VIAWIPFKGHVCEQIQETKLCFKGESEL